MIILTSSEGTEFVVGPEVIEKSTLIKLMLEDVGDCNGDTAIPLSNVSGPILTKVIEYCIHHQEDPTESDDDRPNTSEDISEWDYEFCQVGQETLFELILAANYLEIKSLLSLTCRTVANIIQGRSPEEIRKVFKISNDLEQVRREHEWCDR
ncbi:hypothetical protein K7432_002668 [Basidiobolus ranarum]|uniref:E3 ubiquitin ligase complex SCF subunit n=1 Tax=Basidiobolus ranarum TaxID=34480 RepID=A0ABR2W7F6_9FUNG